MDELKHYMNTGLRFALYIDGKLMDIKKGATGVNYTEQGMTLWFGTVGYSDEDFTFVPILKPLTELKAKLEGLENEVETPNYFLTDLLAISKGDITDWRQFKVDIFHFLIKRHYDVFDLIEKGLAIDSTEQDDGTSEDFTSLIHRFLNS